MAVFTVYFGTMSMPLTEAFIKWVLEMCLILHNAGTQQYTITDSLHHLPGYVELDLFPVLE